MLTPTSELLARAQAYVDADDVNVGGWLNDNLWYTWMNQEHRDLYRAHIRAGLMGPKFVDENVTANGSEFYTLADEPLAVAGVAEIVGGYPRPLTQMQVSRGRYPWTNASSTGAATHWQAHYNADGTVTIGLSPLPSSGTYRVRTVPPPPLLVSASPPGPDEADSVSFPHGAEDRIPLGMAMRAYSREGVSSPSLMALIKRADEEMARATAELLMGQAPRVRNVDYENRGWRRRGQDQAPVLWTATPNQWWWSP